MFLGPQGRKQLAALGGVGLVGIEMGVSILVGFLLGRWLDGKVGTSPWLSWTGFACGILAGFRNLFRIVQRERARIAEQSSNESEK